MEQSKTASQRGGCRISGRRRPRRSADGPLVSVITVCLNAEQTLEQCIRSVLEQTYPGIEYIVLDGGSGDGTLEILRRHEHAIEYWQSERDAGLYQAMNKGLALATGEYILFLNADDWYPADAVESLVKAKGFGCADVVSALAQYVDQAGRPVELDREGGVEQVRRRRMPLRHETMLVPAAIYRQLGGYDESYGIAADFHFVGRLYRAGFRVYEIPRALLYFRNTGVSNRDPAAEIAERTRVIRANFPFLAEPDARTLADVRKLAPERLVDVALRHSERTELLHAIQAYLRYRSRTARKSAWAECERSWPAAAVPHPQISVVLPVFNAEKTLAAAIDSVLAQSFRDFELICVDDRSTDGSRRIIAEYQAKDARIALVENGTNLGHGGSRNRGVDRARGAYVFHLDPDDTIPADALETLHSHAAAHGCDIVKGAYRRERQHFDAETKSATTVNLCPKGRPFMNTRLAEMPSLLHSTEGHWSSLYRRDLAKQAPYGGDLRMGEDSIFVVRAFSMAQKIGLLERTVYRYQANPTSAMNTFTHRKYMDGLEWRRRAWHVLSQAGFGEIAERILRAYWRESFFSEFAKGADAAQFREFCAKLRAMFEEAGFGSPGAGISPALRAMLAAVMSGEEDAARRRMLALNRAGPARALRVATLSSKDDGGAGSGSQRRVEALRKHGVDAKLFVLAARSGKKYVRRLSPEATISRSQGGRKVWQAVQARAILSSQGSSTYRGREMFSVAESVLDFRKLRSLFDRFDVIHLHWVVGMLDYEHLGEVLGDKPLVWTLADMNPFTGGCHFSEGCDGYKRDCHPCPLLDKDSDIARSTWRKKQQAYSQLKNLRVVCTSHWMAERVRQSSLLGGREVAYIPNPMPLERFSFRSKVVARLRLGLPLRKRLLIFSADSLSNRRKGGDLLQEAMARVSRRAADGEIELIVVGNHPIRMPYPVHQLGYIDDESMLALAYAAADGCLFPSREENAPLTVSEALLCGTPVISFPVGNVADLIEHKVNGYLAKPLDVEDFARGIQWVLEAPPAAALERSALCRMRASAVHDPEAAVARHEALYRRAIAGAGRAVS